MDRIPRDDAMRMNVNERDQPHCPLRFENTVAVQLPQKQDSNYDESRYAKLVKKISYRNAYGRGEGTVVRGMGESKRTLGPKRQLSLFASDSVHTQYSNVCSSSIREGASIGACKGDSTGLPMRQDVRSVEKLGISRHLTCAIAPCKYPDRAHVQ